MLEAMLVTITDEMQKHSVIDRFKIANQKGYTGSSVLTFNSIATFCTVMEKDFPDEYFFLFFLMLFFRLNLMGLPQSEDFEENLMYWIAFFTVPFL